MGVEELYDLLTPENKIKFQQFIENLTEDQCTPLPSSCSLP